MEQKELITKAGVLINEADIAANAGNNDAAHVKLAELNQLLTVEIEGETSPTGEEPPAAPETL